MIRLVVSRHKFFSALLGLVQLGCLTAFWSGPAAADDAGGQYPVAVDASKTGPEAPAPVLRADHRDTLSRFGTFQQHPRYGEVWIPTITPQGWHPYPPCHWVNTRRYGWFFDDRTAWGAIVHHYGRWAHDDKIGWIWVPDEHFSPGWVVWRTSPQWIGWAPMLPEADIRVISEAAFDNGGFWIFTETARFVSGCSDGAAAPAAQIADLVRQTQYVTQLSYTGGIAIVQLPSYIVGTFVNVEIIFDPWPTWYFVSVVGNWNWVWSNLTIIINVVDNCPRR